MNAEADPPTQSFLATWTQKWQFLLDKTAPHALYRWIGFAIIMTLYCVRVYFINGFFIITYGLGIYLLNQFIGFLTPQFDPEDSQDDLGLPTREAEEYRPFARRLPEFKFWYCCIQANVISIFLTFFPLFDVPVFWPILLLYFLILFFVTMKKQIQHMIKHRYVPWSFGKQTYTGK